MGFEFSIEPLKEPRGFIRLIELILAIFAFATCCSLTTKVVFEVKCNQTTTLPNSYKMNITYPFSLTSVSTDVELCDKTTKKGAHFSYGPKSPAEFFVFVGVMAMLYTVAAFVLYVFFDDLYRKNNFIIIADFVVTAVWTLLWLLSSSIWAQGVADLKTYSDPGDTLILGGSYPLCTKDVKGSCVNVKDWGNFASVNVSVVFGFLNMIVWGGNCWFLYKETPWFKKREEDYIPDPDPARVSTPQGNDPTPLY